MVVWRKVTNCRQSVRLDLLGLTSPSGGAKLCCLGETREKTCIGCVFCACCQTITWRELLVFLLFLDQRCWFWSFQPNRSKPESELCKIRKQVAFAVETWLFQFSDLCCIFCARTGSKRWYLILYALWTSVKFMGLMLREGLCQSNFSKRQTGAESEWSRAVQLFSVKLFQHWLWLWCLFWRRQSSIHYAVLILIFDHGGFVGALHACPAMWLFIDHRSWVYSSWHQSVLTLW